MNEERHFRIISTIFSVIVVISNIISGKLFSLPLLEQFSVPAGIITYPLTFLLSDFVTEIFGPKKSKEMVQTALGMSFISFILIYLALLLPSGHAENAAAFKEVFSLNGLIISASLIAYLLSQMLDIKLYLWIWNLTGPKHLWLRNNGSTLISQFVDTMIVSTIHLYFGLGFELTQVIHIIFLSYLYKSTVSLFSTPLFYFLVYFFKAQSSKRKLTYS